MCRHLAWRGRPCSLQDLVAGGPHALYAQSWAPRRQRHGTVNVDGFGVGWWLKGREEPVRYRRAQPIWTDASFASLAPTIESGSVIAAVRSATPGTAPDESAAAPFRHQGWLFSHNGRLADWEEARAALGPAAADVAEARAGVDSALLFGLAVARWRDGVPLMDGLASATRVVLEHGGGRLTTLAGDGTTIAGVVCGEPMWTHTTTHGVLVASEPSDDDPAWLEIPDETALRVDDDGVHLTSL